VSRALESLCFLFDEFCFSFSFCIGTLLWDSWIQRYSEFFVLILSMWPRRISICRLEDGLAMIVDLRTSYCHPFKVHTKHSNRFTIPPPHDRTRNEKQFEPSFSQNSPSKGNCFESLRFRINAH
jgi:hypothetical protein